MNRVFYQINRTRSGIKLRDVDGVRDITAKRCKRLRHYCINSGYAVWSASDKTENYLMFGTADIRHAVNPVSEIEVFVFKDEGELIIRLANRDGVKLLSDTITVRVPRETDYKALMVRLGFDEVKLSGIGSAKRGSYKLFRSAIVDFLELRKIVSGGLSCTDDKTSPTQ